MEWGGPLEKKTTPGIMPFAKFYSTNIPDNESKESKDGNS